MVPTPMRRRISCVLPSLLFGLTLSAQAQPQAPAPAPAQTQPQPQGKTLAQAQALAQALSPTTRPDPLDSKAQVPTLRYASPFVQFRRLGDSQPLDWREANDAVARIGGWRVYTREAQQPDPPAADQPAAPPAQAPVPTPTGPTGHKH